MDEPAIERAMFYIYMVATALLVMPALIAIGIEYTWWGYVSAGLLAALIWNIYKYCEEEY